MSNVARVAGQAANTLVKPLDVDELFSTYLYTGNGSTQTITNGIDLDGEGGLVWVKNRDRSIDHGLYDTERGENRNLKSDSTAAENYNTTIGQTFNSNGFSFNNNYTDSNYSGEDFASWTFRKAPKFFDVVTYTGDGTTNRQISHNLGSTPASIIVKCTSVSTNWVVYHKNLTNADYCLLLNSTSAEISDSTVFGTAPTDTVFTVARTGVSSNTNQSGATYVAYLFAHNDGDGDFGPNGNADIIKCGSFTDNSSGWSVDLGFEPQFLLTKRADSTGNWEIVDTMRGFTADRSYTRLYPNLTNAEQTVTKVGVNSTGFFSTTAMEANGATIIYIAIRRPTAVPESATEVFDVALRSATSAYSVGFPTDLWIGKETTRTNGSFVSDRLRGGTKYLLTPTKGAEQTDAGGIAVFDLQDSFSQGAASQPLVNWNWKRAPKYMDVVAYTGNGTAGRTVAHNLGVAPEMIWVKGRNLDSQDWAVYHSATGIAKTLKLNEAQTPIGIGRITGTSDTTFTLDSDDIVNKSGDPYIAYLFATLAGISKVGSATHSGTTNVDCGFTSGARFVLLKRTDASGDWYVWDSTRGIVSGNDPYLLLNTTAAEVTNTDLIDPLSSGFTITSSLTAGDYIFYAIA